MASGRSLIQLRTAIFVIGGTMLIGGAAALAKAPHHGLALTGAARPSQMVTVTASATPSPATSVNPDPAGSPAVAGATTQAPVSGTATARPAAIPGKGAVPAPAVTSAPAPTVGLSLIDPDGTFNYTVRLLPGADACTVLNEAKAEGKIASVDIDYSYMNTLHSAYVRQINNFANNWTVIVNGTSPRGCSLVSPRPNDQITWRYQ